MRVKIIGIKNARSKKNDKECYTYSFVRPYSDYDNENAACVGETVGIEFSYKDFNVRPGDTVDLQYEKGYEDRAMLSDMVMVAPFENQTDKANKK